ncbi:hypothetical protein EYF80_039539 [Liparis tanakae]|uniref:Uncharacterized protein n=1 Tax=Liparis tanakae TaxID=230148 RepID=A0A4Z2GC19_9TELE|nr:hypothetical protein EYF80_039539 [Liparis tanakae]
MKKTSRVVSAVDYRSLVEALGNVPVNGGTTRHSARGWRVNSDGAVTTVQLHGAGLERPPASDSGGVDSSQIEGGGREEEGWRKGGWATGMQCLLGIKQRLREEEALSEETVGLEALRKKEERRYELTGRKVCECTRRLGVKKDENEKHE